MEGKTTYVFPGSNTPAGFMSFYREGLKDIENIFILKGGPGCGKSTMMRKIGQNMTERGFNVELWQCSSDNDSLDGVLIPALSVAVIDGTPPHTVDPRYPGAVDEIVYLGNCWDKDELKKQRTTIIELTEKGTAKFGEAYGRLSGISPILEQLAEQNISRAHEVCRREEAALLEQIFSTKQPRLRHLFASAITPRGLVSYGEQISRRMEKRILLIGPFGCGRELLLASIARTALQSGHQAEIYHNALHPESIELLLLPGLGMALLAADAAPAMLRDDDVLINCGDAEEADAKAAAEIAELINLGSQSLQEAKALHDELEKVYIRAIDFNAVEEEGDTLFSRILALAAEKA